jgi:hypothetical protein
MSNISWELQGEYFETCSCEFICPCVASNLMARPTNGDCFFAMVFQIERGKSNNTSLDGLSFAVVGRSPDIMGKGSWSVGLIIDEQATPDQQQALTTIASGQAGGPPAVLSGVVGALLGVERRPIRIQKKGLARSVTIPQALEQGCEGIASLADPTQPLYIDNTMHPANARLGLARATASHLHAFGLSWDDTSGKNNGHFAPFNWRSN